MEMRTGVALNIDTVTGTGVVLNIDTVTATGVVTGVSRYRIQG